MYYTVNKTQRAFENTKEVHEPLYNIEVMRRKTIKHVSLFYTLIKHGF